MRPRFALLAVLLAASFGACGKKDDRAPDPVVEEPVVMCDETALDGLEAVPVAEVSLHLDVATDGGTEIFARDFEATLKAIWSAPAIAFEGKAPGDKRVAIWLSTSDAARDAVGGAALTDGYALERTEQAGKTRIIVYARDAKNLVYGGYALLEALGARFFHPKETFLPKLGGPRIPKSLKVKRKPAFATRGLQIHTLHPIEWFEPLLLPGDANLAEAKRLIDWLARTGQNAIQFYILGTIPPAQWQPHVAKVLDYAHARGVKLGVKTQLWAGASLQNAHALVSSKVGWQTQMETKLDELMVVPFDHIGLAMGEFFASDPESVVTWLDHATAYMATKYPKAKLDVTNHVGNYPNLYFDFRGEKKVFFYHVPKFADPRLTNSVHTVFLFDLYRPYGGYGHDDGFAMHRNFLFEQLPKRTIQYIPESAYWATADIDVPAFLPEYINARYIDIHNLTEDVAKKGLPAIDGHILFSSGHEWNYWLTDYLTAQMMWAPEQPLDAFLGHYTSVYGSCAPDVGRAFKGFLDLQTKYLFDRRLIAYISGEDAHDDFGYKSNIVTTPKRVQFEELLTMDAAKRTAFERDTVAALEEMASQITPHVAAVAARCRGSKPELKSFCDELRDGMSIVELRARHAAVLYRAVLAKIAGQDAAPWLVKAKGYTGNAAKVIAEREKHYRFPKEKLADSYKNATIYPFGYLHQASTQCYWHRREEQVAYILENGETPPFAKMPSCQD